MTRIVEWVAGAAIILFVINGGIMLQWHNELASIFVDSGLQGLAIWNFVFAAAMTVALLAVPSATRRGNDQTAAQRAQQSHQWLEQQRQAGQPAPPTTQGGTDVTHEPKR